jgi:membrane-associated phospholipid phosphatase
MRAAEIVNLVYFSLLTLLAAGWPLPRPSRIKAIAAGLAGIAVNVAAVAAGRWMPEGAAETVRDWLPVPLMAVAYWQSGCFFQKPDSQLQSIFENCDRRVFAFLGIRPSALAATAAGAFLEAAYLLCYPVVPLGLAALYLSDARQHTDEYWAVLMLSAYPCYALLPFIQLLPPRLIEREAAATPAAGSIRRLNLWIVRRFTHEANTFPSGHVAASTAIALVVFRSSPAAGTVFAAIAAGIAAGCVIGRYHYFLDVGAALLLALTMFELAIP